MKDQPNLNTTHIMDINIKMQKAFYSKPDLDTFNHLTFTYMKEMATLIGVEVKLSIKEIKL